MTDEPVEPRCATCAAFVRARDDERLGRVGECALQVFPPPVRPTSTCSRWRGKGSAAPPPKPRVAGEPRGRGAPRASSSPEAPEAPRPQLPKEIDLDMDIDEFRRVLRDVLREELGDSRPQLGARWQGGELILKPGKDGTQEKRVPIDSLFHKVVMIRDKLRLLEAKLNAHDGLSAEDKVQLQAYVTGCYGSLTTFNLLFADERDKFVGAGSKD